MDIQIICGFLGAGKTTLLKQILQQQTSDTAVLVNEFGELGVDGTLLAEGTKMAVVEMPSGCICCSLKDDLLAVVEQIKNEHHPRLLIIEPSGIAAPSSIILGLQQAKFSSEIHLKPVVGIIDLTFFIEVIQEDEMGNFFKDQILNSDILLLNKADLVTDQVIENCRQAISTLNPTALVIPTVYCQTELPPTKARGAVAHFHFSSQLNAEVFTCSGLVSKDKLGDLLEQIKNQAYGQVLRAKGIVATQQGMEFFDFVHGLISFGRLNTVADNKFVFIGRDLPRERLEAAVKEVMINAQQ